MELESRARLAERKYCSGGPFRVLLHTLMDCHGLVVNVYSKERRKLKLLFNSVGFVLSAKSEGRSTIKVTILGKEPQASEMLVPDQKRTL